MGILHSWEKKTEKYYPNLLLTISVVSLHNHMLTSC